MHTRVKQLIAAGTILAVSTLGLTACDNDHDYDYTPTRTTTVTKGNNFVQSPRTTVKTTTKTTTKKAEKPKKTKAKKTTKAKRK